MVTSTWECLLPQLTSIFAQHTEEEDKEALERVWDDKEDLEDESGCSDCESTKEPGQSEQEHHTYDADEKTKTWFYIHFLVIIPSVGIWDGVSD